MRSSRPPGAVSATPLVVWGATKAASCERFSAFGVAEDDGLARAGPLADGRAYCALRAAVSASSDLYLLNEADNDMLNVLLSRLVYRFLYEVLIGLDYCSEEVQTSDQKGGRWKSQQLLALYRPKQLSQTIGELLVASLWAPSGMQGNLEPSERLNKGPGDLS